MPTNRSLVIASGDWRDIIAASPVRQPLIVSEELTPGLEGFIDDYAPDFIYTLGIDLEINNSFRIERDQVPGLFFPNATDAVIVESPEEGMAGSQIAYLEGVPIVFDDDGWDEAIDVRGLGFDVIRDIYLGEVEDSGGNINYIVLANIDNESSLLAGRLAGSRSGVVVPVDIEGIGYEGEPVAVNEANHVGESIQTIQEAVQNLGEKGMFHRSREFRRGGPLFLALMGNGMSVPHVMINDPGLELISDKDGPTILTDFPYGDLNGDSHLDLAVGRLSGGLPEISLQMERMKLPRGKDAVLIGQYRHRNYQDLLLMGGGMAQAMTAQEALDKAGWETRRIIENRTEHPLKMGLKDMFEMASYHYGLRSLTGIGKAVSSISFLWGIVEAGETFLHAFLEFDWKEWLEALESGAAASPRMIEVLYPDTELGEPEILGYFGVGDRYWIVPPDNKDDIELVTNPYARATEFRELEYSGFLVDEHDLSAQSEVEKQVLEAGGMAAASTGIVHDPSTIYYSTEFFEGLSQGRSAGESMRGALNNVIPDGMLSAAELMTKQVMFPNLYFKTRYEKILLGDPSFSPVREVVQEKGDAFRIRPGGSFTAEASVVSDFVVRDGRVQVRNADSVLAENGLAYVPVFVREIILPRGSDVGNVGFSGFYRTYRGIEPLMVPWDEYYPEGSEEEIPDIYPESDYWSENFELADGRILVRAVIPAVIYQGNRAKVLVRGTLGIHYDAPIEVVVRAENIRLGHSEDVEVEIVNQGGEEVSGTLLLWVAGREFSGEVSVGPGETAEEVFTFTPEEAGNYQAKAVFDSEEAPGPRYSDFRVWDRAGGRCAFLGWLKKAIQVRCGAGQCGSQGQVLALISGIEKRLGC